MVVSPGAVVGYVVALALLIVVLFGVAVGSMNLWTTWKERQQELRRQELELKEREHRRIDDEYEDAIGSTTSANHEIESFDPEQIHVTGTVVTELDGGGLDPAHHSEFLTTISSSRMDDIAENPSWATGTELMTLFVYASQDSHHPNHNIEEIITESLFEAETAVA